MQIAAVKRVPMYSEALVFGQTRQDGTAWQTHAAALCP
jgi:hypothetical protein